MAAQAMTRRFSVLMEEDGERFIGGVWAIHIANGSLLSLPIPLRIVNGMLLLSVAFSGTDV